MVDPSDNGDTVPKLFRPLKIRGLVVPNRIFLSPLCQYSAEDGHYTDWHLTHMGGIIQRGPGLATVEATAVTPQGRISPHDVGLWKDSQIAPLKRLVDFAHSQNQKVMIQLSHAGRKASTVAPWLSGRADAAKDTWPDDVYGPSPIPWNERHAKPKEMSLQDIQAFKDAFVASVKRALTAGFDAIEIHNAHGYLLHEFLSPVANIRKDQYGGSFVNRTRLTLEVVDLVRAAIPKGMPLFLRISASDWLEEAGIEGWTSQDTVRLAPLLADKGVDVLDVSSGGNHPKQQPRVRPAYQAPFAFDVKKAIGDKMLVTSVGCITEGKQANDLLNEGLDAVFVGRMFLKNPGLVFAWADELEQVISMPKQMKMGLSKRGATQNKSMLEVMKA